MHPNVQQVLDTLAPTDDPRMLGRLDGYEISGVIGAGGMGVVLKGLDRSLDRVVAIKVMAPHLAASGAARTRFAREAQAAAAMTHDNVIDIYGVSEANGLPYLVTPYARGPSLQKRIDDRGPLPVVEVLRIGTQIAAGLAAAHAQGLVHRDVKPANILLSDGIDRLVITDFGLARAVDDVSVTRTGVIAGTPQYMSPEQARGDAVDRRSDLFSLGSVLYTACTGRPPFRADGAYGILRRITDNEPRPIREVNPDVPEWFCRVVEKLHAKSPDDRYQAAGEVVELLTQCLAHIQTPNTPLPAELYVARRRPSPVMITAAVVSAGVLALALFFLSRGGETPPIHNTDDADTQAASAPSVSAANGRVEPSPQVGRGKERPDAETAWTADATPSPEEIHETAGRLAEEARSFFAPGPDALSKEPDP